MHKVTKISRRIANDAPTSFPPQSQETRHNVAVRRPRSPRRLPLGNTTESASRGSVVLKNDEFDNSAQLKPRLNPYSLLRRSKDLAPYEDRCQICQTVRHDFTDTPGIVEIRRSGEGKHSFGNLYCCGNVWTCAVCAHRTARQRGEEVKSAMEAHRLSGGRCYLVTYTLQHKSYSNLGFIVNALREANREFKSGRWFQYAKREIVGTISGLETTWGRKNGWHPHTHEIVFRTGRMSLYERAEWKARWRTMLEKQAMYGGDVAMDIRECFPSDYNCKFGADFEVTGDFTKDDGGLSPWQILSLSEDARYAELWLEYVATFKGRRRLTWTKGLKHHFGIEDVDDHEEPTETVATLSKEKYQVIARNGWEREFLISVDEIGFDDTHHRFFDDMDYYRRFRLDRAGGGGT